MRQERALGMSLRRCIDKPRTKRLWHPPRPEHLPTSTPPHSSRYAIVAALALVSLAGCTTLDRTIEPEPIFPGPSATIDVSSLGASITALCAKDAHQGNSTVIPAESMLFSVAMTCAYNAGSKDELRQYWISRFIDKGVALSDQTCGLFFDRLEARRVEASYSQTNFNVVGTAVTAILAVTETHHRAIFNVATALAAGNAWFENYKANYVMTPQLRKVHNKIQVELRDPIKARIQAKDKAGGYGSFDEAKQDLMRYDALCSHKVIADVITESVIKSELVVFGAQPPAAKPAEADAEIKLVYDAAAPRLADGSVSPGTFAKGQLEALYAVASIDDPAERQESARALLQLSPGLAPFVSTLRLNATPGADVITRLRYIGQILGWTDDPGIANLRKKIADKVAENRKSPPPPPGAPGAAAPLSPEALQARREFGRTMSTLERAAPSPTINFNWAIKDNSRR